MMPSTKEEWDAHNYRYSRNHATAEYLDAMAGIAPGLGDGRRAFGPRQGQVALRCGETFAYAGRVTALDIRPEVTCPKCRVLMRAIRPQSAPLYETKPSPLGSTCYFVGGEMVSRAEYEERVIRLATIRQGFAFTAGIVGGKLVSGVSLNEDDGEA